MSGLGSLLKFIPGFLAQLQRQMPAQAPSSDPLAGLHDIAGPVVIPSWWSTPAGIATASAGALALLACLVYFWLRIRAQRAVVVPPLPRDKAIAALGHARLQLGRMEPDAFVALVSDILRTYVSEQFGFHAREQTSQEFLEALSGFARFNERESKFLAGFLEVCDLIKFAREPAGEPECSRLLDEAVQFVNQSAPVSETVTSGR